MGFARAPSPKTPEATRGVPLEDMTRTSTDESVDQGRYVVSSMKVTVDLEGTIPGAKQEAIHSEGSQDRKKPGRTRRRRVPTSTASAVMRAQCAGAYALMKVRATRWDLGRFL